MSEGAEETRSRGPSRVERWVAARFCCPWIRRGIKKAGALTGPRLVVRSSGGLTASGYLEMDTVLPLSAAANGAVLRTWKRVDAIWSNASVRSGHARVSDAGGQYADAAPAVN